MAGKKVKNEVEGIRNELQHLSEAVWALREHVTIQTAAAAAATSPGKHHKGKHEDVAADLDGHRDTRGAVVTRGVVRDAAGAREYRWDAELGVDALLADDDDGASKLLAAIGHRQRLGILKKVLDKPTTAADLVNSLELGTTGAAYHHLNVLQSADLVTQEGRGVFAVKPERVAALFAMLAGIASAASVSTAVDDAEEDGGDGESGKGKKKKGS
jgi:DNA gyrase subunit B